MNNTKIASARPRYTKSTLALGASVLDYCGVKTKLPKLGRVRSALKKNYKNVVFLILDGLNTLSLQELLPADSLLRKNLKGSLTSVFPSTTACGLTTLFTAGYPAANGWLGQKMYIEQLDKVIDIYKNTCAYTGVSLKDDDYYESYLPPATIFSQIEAMQKPQIKIHTLTPQKTRNIAENNYYYSDMAEMYTVLNKMTRQNGRKAIIAYAPHLSKAMSTHGTASGQAEAVLQEHELYLAELMEKAGDTLFIVSSGHGMINIQNNIHLEDYPEICATFNRPPSVCSRAISFGINKLSRKQFARLFNHHFSTDFKLYTAKQIVAGGLLGKDACPCLDLLIGDFIAVAKANSAMHYKTPKGVEPKITIASSGGLSKQEMLLPLIIFGKKKKSSKKKAPQNSPSLRRGGKPKA
ncbi:MAG: alkaline phosphatase family protein [Firmicutes bacterium]|nr:alkaline phosphatase family protein [Bacillota bacterium]